MTAQTTIEKREQRAVARPLKELIKLIKVDLHKINDIRMESIRTVAEMMQPVRIAIGEKLIEAKPQVKHGSFKSWISKTFPILGYHSASEYMRMASQQKLTGVNFSGPQHFRRITQPGYKKNHTGTANWRNEVQSRLNNFNVDQFTKHDDKDRIGEQQIVKKLAAEIVSIGYKVLATKMHPDKGGSIEGMQRLNDARDMLKEAL
jgi:hypothetical protein